MRALVAAALVAAIPASAESPAITVSIGCEGGMPMLIQIEAKRAAVDGPQFDYRLGTPSDWRSGWCVLTFREGVLMPPEFCTVIDEEAGTVFFRGELLQV